MPEITITLAYDDGTKIFHTATLPRMSKSAMDTMIVDAALQAHYQPEIEGLDDDGKPVTAPNKVTPARHLCGWLFGVMAGLVSSRRADQSADAARETAIDAAAALKDATAVE